MGSVFFPAFFDAGGDLRRSQMEQALSPAALQLRLWSQVIKALVRALVLVLSRVLPAASRG